MSALVALFLLFASLARAAQPQTYVFDQYVDHFNFETQPQTFQQRYLVNDEFWLAPRNKSVPWGGDVRPIFFYTGNEAPITAFYEISGFVLTLAKVFNALVVFAEHRFRLFFRNDRRL